MTVIQHTHASGRYDRSPESLFHAVVTYIEGGAGLLTLTEVSAEKREAALRSVCQAHEYSVVTGDKGGMDDAAVMWNKAMFTCIASGTHILSGFSYDAKGGGVVYAAWAVLRITGGKKLLVMVAHQASGVERGTGLGGALQRVRKWQKDTTALKHVWNELADKYGVDAIVVTCDWNVNIKRLFFRRLLHRKYPGMDLVVDPKNFPSGGTLGSRLIDFSFVRGAIKGSHVHIMPQNNSSDHKPFKQTLTIG